MSTLNRASGVGVISTFNADLGEPSSHFYRERLKRVFLRQAGELGGLENHLTNLSVMRSQCPMVKTPSGKVGAKDFLDSLADAYCNPCCERLIEE